MATLSLRMADDLKRKAQKIAQRQGVSLNHLINTTVAASVAQEETLIFFKDHLKDVDLDVLTRRVHQFMKKTKPGTGPTHEQLRNALGSVG